MTPLEIAHRYMRSFYGQEPLENMAGILANDLDFEGPFYRFESGHDYLLSLQENPPAEVSYEIINEYENSHSACLIYQFNKPGIETLMAQYFEIRHNRIAKIRLIFDSGKFT